MASADGRCGVSYEAQLWLGAAIALVSITVGWALALGMWFLYHRVMGRRSR